jgi:hypothetical protein
MPEIGTSGSMSGDGKRSVGHRPQATAPILDSTISRATAASRDGRFLGSTCRAGHEARRPLMTRSGLLGPTCSRDSAWMFVFNDLPTSDAAKMMYDLEGFVKDARCR